MLILSNKQCMLQYVKLHLTQINSIKSRTVYLNDDDDDDELFIHFHPMTSCCSHDILFSDETFCLQQTLMSM